MRVVNVITRLNVGGASPPVIALAAQLRRRHHESLLVCGMPQPAEGSMNDDAISAGVELVRISELRRPPHVSRDLVALGKLVRLFRRHRPDVVATHMTKAGLLGRLAARVVGVPVVVHTYHGQGFKVFKERWKERLVLGLERRLARLATGNIVVSEIQKHRFLEWGIGTEATLRVIRYGVDLEPYLQAGEFSKEGRSELGVPGDGRFVGVVGRLVEIKGQDVFIEAAAKLAHRYPDASFLLVGDGPARGDYERLTRLLGLAERVQFLGWRRDIPRLLAKLDVVVLSTAFDFEGTPLAVIEALAAGRPVVATAVGGVPEVVRNGETGFLVPPRDPGALADAIATALDDPGYAAKLGRQGQQVVRALYGRDRMVDETERYFAECLEAQRAPTR